MSQRERPAASGVSEAVPRPATGLANPSRSASPLEPGPSRAPLWEEWYHAASPAQQQEALDLAQRQGIIYSAQLPSVPRVHSADRHRQFLSRFLNGRPEGLLPVRPDAPKAWDPELDPVQREAVGKALASPDICLIQGLPGTGKSRVVAEIVTQAAIRGERVLLLAPNTPALDHLLALVADREPFCAVRCLGRDERAGTLPPAIAALTVAERLKQAHDQAAAAAQRQVTEAEQRCHRRRQDDTVLARMLDLAESWEQRRQQIAELAAARARIPADVEAEATTAVNDAAAGAFATALQTAARARAEVVDQVAAALPPLQRRIDQGRAELQKLAGQLDILAPLAAAKVQGKWWTGAWWKATFAGNVPAQVEELKKKRNEHQLAVDGWEQDAASLSQQRDEAEAAWTAARARLIEAEVGRRTAEVQDREAALGQDQRLLEEKWQLLNRELVADSPRPEALTVVQVTAARAALQRQVDSEERQAAFARHWAETLPQVLECLPARLTGYTNLVAATTAAIGIDEHFGDGTPHAASFDLLILDGAHQVTESEFLSAARRARRWVLVGEPTSDHFGQPVTDHSCSGNAGPSVGRIPSRGPSVAALKPGFFQRLWHNLHCDPRQWPYAWVLEKDRLCCQLRPVPAEQRQWLESERVADFPDIELRILALPRTQPVLTEVVFPPTITIYQAKEYIFRELQELPVKAVGHSLRWSEEPDRLVLRLADAGHEEAVAVHLQPGIREMVGALPVETNGSGPSRNGAAWTTCCLEFDRTAGWHRASAEDWVHLHLGARDLGRTVQLDVPHRMAPALARWVADVLFDGTYRVPSSAEARAGQPGPFGPTPVVFVPVPGQPRDNHRQPKADGHGSRSGNPSRQQGRGGAGIELDLADPRHRDRLPSELRPCLPERGLVNYLEAQSLVRLLTGAAADLVGRGIRSVAVMALYSAQAELIRRMLTQGSTLAAQGLHVQVDVPDAFRERDFPVVLLSLTRSHTHRAVSYGEDPAQLALALTRARQQLVLFGDPGTLIRRTQWEGALDHLDPEAAARERERIALLVQYLQGHGRHARAFHLREGTSP